MKIFLDDNLSPKLIERLQDLYPEAHHVHFVGLGGADDLDIWRWAKTEGYLICTKDSDFYHHAILHGPPKVLWLKLGNCSNLEVEQVLRENFDLIQRFAAGEEEVLILGQIRR